MYICDRCGDIVPQVYGYREDKKTFWYCKRHFDTRCNLIMDDSCKTKPRLRNGGSRHKNDKWKKHIVVKPLKP